MRRLMEYKIISGRTVEVRRSIMAARNSERKSHRAPKVAGASSEAKIKRNEQEAVKQLARIINCNFQKGDLFITLKYIDDKLPSEYEHHRKVGAEFIRKLRNAEKKAEREMGIYIMVNANWSPKRNAPARLHHHLIIKDTSIDTIREVWEQYGTVSVEVLDNRADHSDLAAYLIANVKPETAGQRRYTKARGMDKPIYTEPVEVDDPEGIRPEKDAVIKAYETAQDEEGRIMAHT